jgi:hypothetical protein
LRALSTQDTMDRAYLRQRHTPTHTVRHVSATESLSVALALFAHSWLQGKGVAHKDRMVADGTAWGLVQVTA